MARKKAKSEAPKKIKPISLNILEIAKRLQTLEQTAGGGGDTSALANKSDIATEFNTTTTYTAGCFVYHEGKLYQFNADHAAGAWDPTDVVEANVTDQVVSNKAAIDAIVAPDIVTVSVTLGTGASPSAVKICDYPDGFNQSNTRIISIISDLSGGSSLTWNGMSQYSAVWFALLRSDGIYGIWNNTDLNGAPTKITLLKL